MSKNLNVEWYLINPSPVFQYKSNKPIHEPVYYLERWLKKKYSPTPFQIKSRTNSHVSANGNSWGWWEIYPFRLIIGYWEKNVHDDLEDNHFDVDTWNEEARRLCAPHIHYPGELNEV